MNYAAGVFLWGALVIQGFEEGIVRAGAVATALAAIVFLLHRFWTRGIRPVHKAVYEIKDDLKAIGSLQVAFEKRGVKDGEAIVEYFDRIDQANEAAFATIAEFATKRQERAEMNEHMGELDGRIDNLAETVHGLEGKMDQVLDHLRHPGETSPF